MPQESSDIIVCLVFCVDFRLRSIRVFLEEEIRRWEVRRLAITIHLDTHSPHMRKS